MGLTIKPTIDTGDVVYVRGIGERWLVAFEKDGWLTCCGWPEARARAEQCRLLRKATPEERDSLLRDMAKSEGSRGEYARRRLEVLAKDDLQKTMDEARRLLLARGYDVSGETEIRVENGIKYTFGPEYCTEKTRDAGEKAPAVAIADAIESMMAILSEPQEEK